MRDFLAELHAYYRNHRLVDDPEPGEQVPPEGFVYPSLIEAHLEHLLRDAWVDRDRMDTRPLPVVVRCRLSSKVGVIEVRFWERKTGRELHTMREVCEVLSEGGIMGE